MINIRIGPHDVGPGHVPFVIAELSGNHNGDLQRALATIDAIGASGAQAVKIQTYTADTITLDLRDDDFLIKDPSSLWFGRSLHDLYQEAHTPWAWHEALFERAAQHGLLCFSTPFDDSAVDFLESLAVPAYKIASFENTDVRLLRKVARTGKPVIVSTGMANLSEIHQVVRTLRDEGNDQIVLLKCTSNYPADPADSHLRTIPHLQEAFDVLVGLSDHTLGIGVPIASVALGACVVEKHVTLDRSEGGVDAAFSLEPAELRTMVDEIGRAHAALGTVQYGASAAEEGSKQFRRSLYIVEDLPAGTALRPEHVRSIRPGYGLPVADFDRVIGMNLRVDVRRGTPLSWSLFV